MARLELLGSTVADGLLGYVSECFSKIEVFMGGVDAVWQTWASLRAPSTRLTTRITTTRRAEGDRWSGGISLILLFIRANLCTVKLVSLPFSASTALCTLLLLV